MILHKVYRLLVCLEVVDDGVYRSVEDYRREEMLRRVIVAQSPATLAMEIVLAPDGIGMETSKSYTFW